MKSKTARTKGDVEKSGMLEKDTYDLLWWGSDNWVLLESEKVKGTSIYQLVNLVYGIDFIGQFCAVCNLGTWVSLHGFAEMNWSG